MVGMGGREERHWEEKKMSLVVLMGEALVSRRDPATRHRDLEFLKSSVCRENGDHIGKVTWSQPSTTKLLQGINALDLQFRACSSFSLNAQLSDSQAS